MNKTLIFLLLLSIAAGAVDVIGFLALGGLFAAHITGNIVILAAHFVTGKFSTLGPLLAVPVFMLVLALVTMFSGRIEKTNFSPLKLLLALQAVMLTISLMIGIILGPFADLNSLLAVVTGMLAVAAMATQSAAIKIAIKKAPSTVAMTNNITQLTLDIAQLLGFHQVSLEDKLQAKQQIKLVLTCISGFVIGCGAGAILQVLYGFNAFLLPIFLSIFSLFLHHD